MTTESPPWGRLEAGSAPRLQSRAAHKRNIAPGSPFERLRREVVPAAAELATDCTDTTGTSPIRVLGVISG